MKSGWLPALDWPNVYHGPCVFPRSFQYIGIEPQKDAHMPKSCAWTNMHDFNVKLLCNDKIIIKNPFLYTIGYYNKWLIWKLRFLLKRDVFCSDWLFFSLHWSYYNYTKPTSCQMRHISAPVSLSYHLID